MTSSSTAAAETAFKLDSIIEGEFSVDASDLIRLILAFLTGQGLHESARVLRKESGIGFHAYSSDGSPSSSSSPATTTKATGAVIQPKAIARSIRAGDWGNVQRATVLWQDGHDDGLSGFKSNKESPSPKTSLLSSRIAEQIILELADEEQGDERPVYSNNSSKSQPFLALAYSLLKVHREALDRIEEDLEHTTAATAAETPRGDVESSNTTTASRISKARSLEQRLAAISASSVKFANDKDARQHTLYGSTSKQDRRNLLAQQVESLHEVPTDRLPVLIQQSMKWQSYTGQLPWVKEETILADDGDGDADEERNGDGEAAETSQQQQQQRRRRRRGKKRKRYDLVVGLARDDVGMMVGDGSAGPDGMDGQYYDDDEYEAQRSIPTERTGKVKFGSNVCEAAVFVLGSGSSGRGGKGCGSLVTASSDGLIEIWDSSSSYRDLNTTDYPFQKDSVMGHKDASVLCLTMSNDGEILVSGDSRGCVKVWKAATGKCLRQFGSSSQQGSVAVTCLALSRDATKLLIGNSNGIAREYSVLNQTMLNELEGHTSYLYACHYNIRWTFSEDRDPQTASGERWITTASADGTVRVWKKGICVRILQPPSPSPGMRQSLSVGVSSLVVDPTQLMSEAPAIHSLIPLAGQEGRMIVVPRCSTAYLVDLQGIVLQSFQADTDDDQFVAATASSSAVYLATVSGHCLVFSIHSGKLLKSIRNFSNDSTSKTTTNTEREQHRSSAAAEISSIIHHPYKPSVIAAFSNDKTQKKGILAVWS